MVGSRDHCKVDTSLPELLIVILHVPVRVGGERRALISTERMNTQMRHEPPRRLVEARLEVVFVRLGVAVPHDRKLGHRLVDDVRDLLAGHAVDRRGAVDAWLDVGEDVGGAEREVAVVEVGCDPDRAQAATLVLRDARVHLEEPCFW